MKLANNLDSLERQMFLQNPHWQEGAAVFPEVSMAKKRMRFVQIKDRLQKNPWILALSGPRRLGKSYLLKQLIKELTSVDGILPTNILYFLFSPSLNEKDIIKNLFLLFLKHVKKPAQVFVFLDEVQYIDFWQDQVKYFYDTGANLKFVITGSTNLFYKQKSKETLAGRIVRENFWPLTFAEYLKFKGLKFIKPRDLLLFNLDKIKSREYLMNLKKEFLIKQELVETELKKYLCFGQYPELAASLYPERDMVDFLANLSRELIDFDIPFLNPKVDRALFSRLVKFLSQETAQEFSLGKTAAALGADRKELSGYLHLLEELNLFAACQNSFFKSAKKKWRAGNKIYALNTNLSLNINGFNASYLNDNYAFGHYFENLAFIRLKEGENQHLFPSEVEFFQNKSQEIDFTAGDFCFEVKSGEIKYLEKYAALVQKLKKKLIFLTFDKFEINRDFLQIPLGAF